MKKLTATIYCAATLCLASYAAQASPAELANMQMVDLSHTYGPDTLYWPSPPAKFDHKALSYGQTSGGYFYAAFSLCTPEHGGTHMDAPNHFFKDRQTIDQIPLENLFLPAVVIDVEAQAQADRNYRLTVADIQAFETKHGVISQGSAILLRTGWDQYWPDAKAYLGDDTAGDASNLSFPSFSAAAITYLIEKRSTKLIGLDTASIDYGKTTNFPVHQIVGQANIPGLENLTGLANLPATGAFIIALPMKVKGGSGAPTRVVALIP